MKYYLKVATEDKMISINEIALKYEDDVINNELVVAESINDACLNIAENTSGDKTN